MAPHEVVTLLFLKKVAHLQKITHMALPNVFTKEVAEELIGRINTLTSATPAKWGKMSVSQMLAHCSVTYEYIYNESKFKKPGLVMGLILKLVVKGKVVSEEGYKPGSPTAPDFIIKEEKNFEDEQKQLIGYIRKTQEMGESYFDGKTSHSFGVLNKTEWNNMFYKHLNHHLSQFGA
jgi:hypothetical protein